MEIAYAQENERTYPEITYKHKLEDGGLQRLQRQRDYKDKLDIRDRMAN